MKLIVLLTLSALFASISGAPADFESRIAGGTAVVNTTDSYYVAAIANTSGDHLCSGWIYDDKNIVTSASCVKTYEATPSTLLVTVGMLSQIKPNTPNQQNNLAVAAVKVHLSYVPGNAMYDIAVLQLTTPMAYNKDVYLAYYDALDTTIKPLTVLGWGATMDGGLASIKLMKGNLEIVPDTATYNCPLFYRTVGYAGNYMICAGSPAGAVEPVSPCQYDEGSPLIQMVNGGATVVGMYSRNNGCSGTPLPPSVFTRISSYFSWLKSTAGAGGLQPTPTSTAIPTIPTASCVNCVTTPAPSG